MKITNPIKVLVSLGGGLGAILALHQAQVTFNGSNTSSTKTYNPGTAVQSKAQGLQKAISTLGTEETQIQQQLALTRSQLAQKQQELTQASQAALAAQQKAQSAASQAAANSASLVRQAAQTAASASVGALKIASPAPASSTAAVTAASSAHKSDDSSPSGGDD